MNKPALYRIGAVANLTGLPANTIRTWERRYNVVEPIRSESGGRRYTDRDVERLQLLRTLSGFGEAIGAIAVLENGDLRDRIERHTEATGRPAAPATVGALRVRIDHEALREQVRQLGFSDPNWSIAQGPSDSADAVVIDLTRLGDKPERGLEQVLEDSEARMALVVYEFAKRETLASLADSGARLIRGPLLVQDLERLLRDHLGIVRSVVHSQRADLAPGAVIEDAPPRRFSDTQLARFREMRSTVDCECPNHLSTLISSLNAFERYSRNCENDSPEDAALHAKLAVGSATARALMEDLLHGVLVHDGVIL